MFLPRHSGAREARARNPDTHACISGFRTASLRSASGMTDEKAGVLRRLRPGIGVEIASVRGGRDDAGADHEIGEALLLPAALGIGREQRLQLCDDPVVFEVFRIELRYARTVECRAKIKIVPVRAFTDEA